MKLPVKSSDTTYEFNVFFSFISMTIGSNVTREIEVVVR